MLLEGVNIQITVFERTSSYCGMCEATKRTLDRLGLEHETRALEDQPPEWLEGMKDAGHMNAPIVVVDYGNGIFDEFSGYRPDRISELAGVA